MAKMFSGDSTGVATEITAASHRNPDCIQAAVNRAVGAGT